MKRWLVIAGMLACAFMASEANAKPTATDARSGFAIDHARANLFVGAVGSANGRSPAAAVESSNDVIAGPTFVGRDPDRHIRFQILRDSKF
jgi:hypothetical protein